MLSKGYVLLYHEGVLDSGGQFYVIIAVHGKNSEKYFKLIGGASNITIGQLQDLGHIIQWGKGILNELQIGKLLRDAEKSALF